MKYTGSCHCGEIRFEVEMEIEKLLTCNCSICSRRGHILNFVSEKDFKLLSGQKAIGDYQFGPKKLHHNFCKNCGVNVFGSGIGPDGTGYQAINVRCLENFDFEKYPIQHFDGKKI